MIFPYREAFLLPKKYKKNQQLMDILKPNHNPKKDILTTITDMAKPLEQARDLLQNMTFDTTRVSQSASYVRTSSDEINYIFEKLQQSQLVIIGNSFDNFHT